MSRKKKNQQSKQSDLAIAKLALLAGALDGGREAEASRPSSLLYQARR